MKPRCFVVVGPVSMQIFALVEEDDLGQPIWRRLDFLHDLSAVAEAESSGSAAPSQRAAAPGRFAGRVLFSAGQVARKIGAREVILVGNPVVLRVLAPHSRSLAQDGLETAHVSIEMDRLAAGAARPLPALGGATRGFALASVAVSLPEAA